MRLVGGVHAQRRDRRARWRRPGSARRRRGPGAASGSGASGVVATTLDAARRRRAATSRGRSSSAASRRRRSRRGRSRGRRSCGSTSAPALATDARRADRCRPPVDAGAERRRVLVERGRLLLRRVLRRRFAAALRGVAAADAGAGWSSAIAAHAAAISRMLVRTGGSRRESKAHTVIGRRAPRLERSAGAARPGSPIAAPGITHKTGRAVTDGRAADTDDVSSPGPHPVATLRSQSRPLPRRLSCPCWRSPLWKHRPCPAPAHGRNRGGPVARLDSEQGRRGPRPARALVRADGQVPRLPQGARAPGPLRARRPRVVRAARADRRRRPLRPGQGRHVRAVRVDARLRRDHGRAAPPGLGAALAAPQRPRDRARPRASGSCAPAACRPTTSSPPSSRSTSTSCTASSRACRGPTCSR